MIYWSQDEVAEILSLLVDDDCACNWFGIDEFMAENCPYPNCGECPTPNKEHGCWWQFLYQGGDEWLKKRRNYGKEVDK